MNRLPLIAVALALMNVPAFAHDMTLYPVHAGEAVKVDIFYGDPGDYQPIAQIKFVDISAYDSAGTRIAFKRDVAPVQGTDRKFVIPELRLGDFPKGTYILAGLYDFGTYVHDRENIPVATTLDRHPDAIDSAHYLKFSKALFAMGETSEGFDRVVGQKIEFVPLANPFTAKEGALLPVRLLVDGKPLPNYKVEIGDDKAASTVPNARTNADGVVKVPLSHRGFYRLAVDYRAKSPVPTLYAWEDYTASLVFER